MGYIKYHYIYSYSKTRAVTIPTTKVVLFLRLRMEKEGRDCETIAGRRPITEKVRSVKSGLLRKYIKLHTPKDIHTRNKRDRAKRVPAKHPKAEQLN